MVISHDCLSHITSLNTSSSGPVLSKETTSFQQLLINITEEPAVRYDYFQNCHVSKYALFVLVTSARCYMNYR